MARHSFRIAGLGSGLLLALVLQAPHARADVDVGQLVALWSSRANASTPPTSLFHSLSRRDDGKMRLLVSGPALSNLEGPGLVPLRNGLYAWTATPGQVSDFLTRHPDHKATWSAPRHLMLNRATARVRADIAHATYGLSGRGVVVGIVDTGVDVRHPDLCNADGTSRIAWLLDLSKSPTGKHPDIETAFGCDSEDAPCAVFSGADIDELVANNISGDEPRDTYGHGTHVASLAAGNGLSNDPPVYVGMAPEATLVVVRATRDGEGLVLDPDILLATKFIFATAEQLGMPAVVNLSLGGDFGAHDGTSMLERELSKLVDGSVKGRSIVVAGGNSGQLVPSDSPAYPEPLGIHTTAQVVPYASTRIPVLIGRSATPRLLSQVYIWVATRPTDNIEVGLETAGSGWIDPVAIGRSASADKDDMSALIRNGVTESDEPRKVNYSGAFVSIEGSFENDAVVSLTLRGHGTASIWVQPAGGIDPALNGFGVLMPAAQREGTITIPASAPGLIAVGATLDRPGWTDVNGVAQAVVGGVSRYLVEGEVVPFSAAGPNALDDIKPDLVAPGAYVIGAMSKLTDPRTLAGEAGMFAGGDICSKNSQSCLVVDDNHALSLGTSMASPVVAGAVALLLQQEPTLTQEEILRALQAGTRSVFGLYSTASQVGAGILDVEGSLLALSDRALGTVPSSSRSFLSLGAAFIRPDHEWPVAGMLHLRDDQDRAVDLDVDRLRLVVDRGNVSVPLSRKAPGYYQFSISGTSDTGGQDLTVAVLIDGKPLCKETRPIAVDAPNVRRLAVAGGDCSLSHRVKNGNEAALIGAWQGLGLMALLVGLRRGCRVKTKRLRSERRK